MHQLKQTLGLKGCSSRMERGGTVNEESLKMAVVNSAPWQYIDASRVKQVLKYEDLIPVIEEALKNFSDRENGGIVQPMRTSVQVADRG